MDQLANYMLFVNSLSMLMVNQHVLLAAASVYEQANHGSHERVYYEHPEQANYGSHERIHYEHLEQANHGSHERVNHHRRANQKPYDRVNYEHPEQVIQKRDNNEPYEKAASTPAPRNKTVSAPVGSGYFHGMLSSECVRHYYRLFVSKTAIPRTFRFWHEPPRGQEVMEYDDLFSFRIVGGSMIKIEEAPYTVMYGDWCAGTLIHPDWVLTAAHCKDKFTFVSVGSTYKSQGTKHNICAHFMHPGWSAKDKLHNMDWDYQLLLLETPVQVSDSARPIAIGNAEDLNPEEMVTITGWGHIKYKNSTMQEQLRSVQVPVINYKDCKAIQMKQYKTITPRMFCAGFSTGKKDACQGDSGGPVVFNKRLIGSVSFGVGCAQPNMPGVYASIYQARDWIRNVTELPYL